MYTLSFNTLKTRFFKLMRILGYSFGLVASLEHYKKVLKMKEISEASSALITTEPEPASETSYAFKCFNFLFNRQGRVQECRLF
jgi:hypothetical protein